MNFMLCKHKVADFEKWHAVFRSHAEAQREAGLHILHVLRDASDPDVLVRWVFADNPKPPAETKIIRIRAIAVREVIGQPKEVTIVTMRGE